MKKKSISLKPSLKIFVMLAGIFLLSSCDNLRGLVITQIDVKNQKANPFKITKVDRKECKIEVEDLPTIELLSEEMQGAFCLTAKEFAKYKAKLQSDCKSNNEGGNDVQDLHYQGR